MSIHFALVFNPRSLILLVSSYIKTLTVSIGYTHVVATLEAVNPNPRSLRNSMNILFFIFFNIYIGFII